MSLKSFQKERLESDATGVTFRARILSEKPRSCGSEYNWLVPLCGLQIKFYSSLFSCLGYLCNTVIYLLPKVS